MRFEWDEAKREINLERHKLDFADATNLFDGRKVITYPSPRGAEDRCVTVGAIGSRLYAIVWTARGEVTRFISFRRARDGEEKAYRSRLG